MRQPLDTKSNTETPTAEQTDFADFEKAFSNATSDIVAGSELSTAVETNAANVADVAMASSAWEMQTDAVAANVEDLLTKEETIDDEPEKQPQEEGWANFDQLN